MCLCPEDLNNGRYRASKCRSGSLAAPRGPPEITAAACLITCTDDSTNLSDAANTADAGDMLDDRRGGRGCLMLWTHQITRPTFTDHRSQGGLSGKKIWTGKLLRP